MELVKSDDGSLNACLPSHFPFQVTERESGRCLVATRDISPEESVLTDSAIILGPSSSSVCVVCCTSRTPSPETCSRCGHPLCQLCRDTPLQGNHAGRECETLTSVGYSRDLYNIILPLRFALLKDRDEEMFNWLLQYMDHNQERAIVSPEMHSSTIKIARVLSSSLPGLNHELALRVVGILFTNCFEFCVGSMDARAFYPLVSLINHSCVPNLRHTNLINQIKGGGVDGEIVVMELEAQRAIARGTELTIRYTDYMMSYIQRQRFLSEQWFFQCKCPRCCDPTEFGSLTSSLPCPSCHEGNLLPGDSLESIWTCSSCRDGQSLEQVEEREQNLLNLSVKRPDPYNIHTCLQQLHYFSKVLNNNHFIITGMKQKFLFSFSISLKKVRDLSPDQRKKLSPLFLAQEKYCRQLLGYHELLDPGKSDLKTKLLLELRKVLLLQARVLSDDSEGSKEDLVQKLTEIKGLNGLVYTKIPL